MLSDQRAVEGRGRRRIFTFILSKHESAKLTIITIHAFFYFRDGRQKEIIEEERMTLLYLY